MLGGSIGGGKIHSDRNRTNIGFSITIYIKDTTELKKAVLACKNLIALKMFDSKIIIKST